MTPCPVAKLYLKYFILNPLTYMFAWFKIG